MAKPQDEGSNMSRQQTTNDPTIDAVFTTISSPGSTMA
jgi:hypothetical protein